MHGSIQKLCWHGSSFGFLYRSKQMAHVNNCSNCSIVDSQVCKKKISNVHISCGFQQVVVYLPVDNFRSWELCIVRSKPISWGAFGNLFLEGFIFRWGGLFQVHRRFSSLIYGFAWIIFSKQITAEYHLVRFFSGMVVCWRSARGQRGVAVSINSAQTMAWFFAAFNRNQLCFWKCANGNQVLRGNTYL